MLLGNAVSVIGHGYEDLVGSEAKSHLNIGASVAHGVSQQVAEDLPSPGRVSDGIDLLRVGGDIQDHPCQAVENQPHLLS